MHILHFYIDEDLPYIVLPLIPGKDEEGRPDPELADSVALKKVGYREASAWFAKAEMEWNKNRGVKNKSTLVEWLNYQNKLFDQNSKTSFAVLYNASGTNLSAGKISLSEQHAFAVDHKTHWYSSSSCNDIDCLVGVPNSESVN